MKLFVSAVLLSTLAFTPAFAAKKMMGCSGDGMMKVTNMTSSMPDSPKKMMMNKEIQMANMAASKGDMRGCNKALMRAQMAK